MPLGWNLPLNLRFMPRQCLALGLAPRPTAGGREGVVDVAVDVVVDVVGVAAEPVLVVVPDEVVLLLAALARAAPPPASVAVMASAVSTGLMR